MLQQQLWWQLPINLQRLLRVQRPASEGHRCWGHRLHRHPVTAEASPPTAGRRQQRPQQQQQPLPTTR